MAPVPLTTRIFHITHVENLQSMIRAGWIWSDSERQRRGAVTTNIGYQHIKDRRLQRGVPRSCERDARRLRSVLLLRSFDHALCDPSRPRGIHGRTEPHCPPCLDDWIGNQPANAVGIHGPTCRTGIRRVLRRRNATEQHRLERNATQTVGWRSGTEGAAAGRIPCPPVFPVVSDRSYWCPKSRHRSAGSSDAFWKPTNGPSANRLVLRLRRVS
jgi:hypothetical protein